MLKHYNHLENSDKRAAKRLPVMAVASLIGLSWFLTPVLSANIIGSDFQNFNPTYSPYDFVTVSSSKTLGAGKIGLGFFADQSRNALPYFTGGGSSSGDSGKKLNDTLTNVQGTIGYGVSQNFDLAITVPYIASEKISDDDHFHGHFRDGGVTEWSVTAKYNILNESLLGLAVLGHVNIDQTRNDPYAGSGSKPSFTAEAAADTNLGPVRLAANIGYRWRLSGTEVKAPDGTTPIRVSGNQVIGSAAADFTFLNAATHLIGEIYASQNTYKVSENTERSRTANEALLGVKHFVIPSLDLNAGIAGELRHSVSSVDFRYYAGAHYTIDTHSNETPPTEEPRIETSLPTTSETLTDWVETATEETMPTKQPDEQIIALSDMLFGLNSSTVNEAAAEKNLAGVGQLLAGKRKLKKLVIEGHTCNLGTQSYNLKLSRKRAAAIKVWLTKHYGVPANKVVIAGLGKSHPIASNANEAGRSKNRRVEFKIFYQDPIKQAGNH